MHSGGQQLGVFGATGVLIMRHGPPYGAQSVGARWVAMGAQGHGRKIGVSCEGCAL
jgi:hypothetical protein